MKKIASSTTLKSFVSLVLCFTLVSQLQVRASHAGVAGPGSAAELKSESQFRSEASRYDGAIRAVSGIATMKLEKTEDIQRAIVILDRERPNLKLFFSKLVVIALGDSTLTNAVRKRAASQSAAEAFARELEADRKTVVKLEGADALASRMRQSAESDAAVLRRAGERLKEASEKLKRVSQRNPSPSFGRQAEFKVMRAGFREAASPDAAPAAVPAPAPPGASMIIAELLVAGLFVAAVIIVAALYSRLIIRTREEGEGQALSDCIGAADNRLAGCVAQSNLITIAVCYAANLIDKAFCLGS